MALIDKLTAIADAIRAKTGTSGSMTLPQMAAAIADIPSGSEDAKCWVLTLSQNSAQGATVTIAQDDDWIKAHYNDPSLVLTIAPLFAVPASTVNLLSGVHGNTLMNGTNVYGFTNRYNVAGNAQAIMTYNNPIESSSVHNGFRAASDGTLVFRVRDSGTSGYLAAGSWLITAGIRTVNTSVSTVSAAPGVLMSEREELDLMNSGDSLDVVQPTEGEDM